MGRRAKSVDSASQPGLFPGDAYVPDEIADKEPPKPFRETVDEVLEEKLRAREESERIYLVRVHPFKQYAGRERRLREHELDPYLSQLMVMFRLKPDITILVEKRGVVHRWYERANGKWVETVEAA